MVYRVRVGPSNPAPTIPMIPPCIIRMSAANLKRRTPPPPPPPGGELHIWVCVRVIGRSSGTVPWEVKKKEKERKRKGGEYCKRSRTPSDVPKADPNMELGPYSVCYTFYTAIYSTGATNPVEPITSVGEFDPKQQMGMWRHKRDWNGLPPKTAV